MWTCTHGSTCDATMGCMSQSLRDCRRKAAAGPASRSDAATVAVGFSPRFEMENSRVAERRMNCGTGFSSVATRRGPRTAAFRGLKPTATFTLSLRDLSEVGNASCSGVLSGFVSQASMRLTNRHLSPYHNKHTCDCLSRHTRAKLLSPTVHEVSCFLILLSRPLRWFRRLRGWAVGGVRLLNCYSRNTRSEVNGRGAVTDQETSNNTGDNKNFGFPGHRLNSVQGTPRSRRRASSLRTSRRSRLRSQVFSASLSS